MRDLDDRIRHAYRPLEPGDSELERWWDDLQLARATGPSPVRRRRAGLRAPRVLVAIVVLVVSASSIAIAGPDAIQDFITSGDRSRAADRMEVFEEPPVGTKGLPEQTRNTLEFLAGHDALAGAPTFDADALRLAISYRTNRIALDVRSAPSTDGQACMYFTLKARRGSGLLREHSGGGSCSLAMRYNGHVTVGTMGDIRMGWLVVGLADDAVRAVRVRLSDGRTVVARMGRNAFALHLPDPKLRTRGLLVDLRDGTTLDVAMNGCLRSQLVPPPKSRLGCGFGMNRGPR